MLNLPLTNGEAAMIIPDVDYFNTMVSIVRSTISNMEDFKPQLASCFAMLQLQAADAVDKVLKESPPAWARFVERTDLRWVLISDPIIKFTLQPDQNFSFFLQIQTEGKYGCKDTLVTFRTKDIEMLLTDGGRTDLVNYFMNLLNQKTTAFMKDYNEDSEKALFILGEHTARIND